MNYQALRKQAENVNVYFEVKEASLKRLQMCDSSYVTFWKSKTMDTQKHPWLPSIKGEVEMNRQNPEGF